jgi:diguanylate cyclase (GGDEF)-like protein
VNAYEAVHDSLTGLPNRVLFYDRAEHALAQGRRDGRSLAVALLDLDRFKEVNDTLGHEAGDTLLKELSSRLQGALREGDTVSRLGGDEFGLVFITERMDEVRGVVARIEAALDRPFAVRGLSIGVEASVGIALYPSTAAQRKRFSGTPTSPCVRPRRRARGM